MPTLTMRELLSQHVAEGKPIIMCSDHSMKVDEICGLYGPSGPIQNVRVIRASTKEKYIEVMSYLCDGHPECGGEYFYEVESD